MPHLSPIFSPKYMGGNGRARDGWVIDGVFAEWPVPVLDIPVLTRKFDQGTRISPFPSSDVLTRILATSADYDALRRNIEFGPAGGVHESIGGVMSMKLAAYDPIFWLHIAYVDSLWNSWQRRSPNRLKVGFFNGGYSGAQTDPNVPGTRIIYLNGDHRKMDPNTLVPGLKYPHKLGELLDIKNLCYDYK
jgi:hypothetical protein